MYTNCQTLRDFYSIDKMTVKNLLFRFFATTLTKFKELQCLLHFLPSHFAITNGAGQGISLFTRLCNVNVQNSKQNQVEKMVVNIGPKRLICIYNKNKSGNVVAQEVLHDVQKRRTVVFGDFNMNPINQLAPHFEEQMVIKPTFHRGTLIDHLYRNCQVEYFSQHSVIFSDHDCISFAIENKSDFN